MPTISSTPLTRPTARSSPRWAEQDSGTDVVALYLESFGNPLKFARIARRVSRTKPIVAVKGGASNAGSRAAASHTAAAMTPHTHVDALFRQADVITADGLGELLDTVTLLTHQPLRGGVVVGLANPPAAAAAYLKMAALLGDGMGGGLVSPAADPGVETLAGVVQDPAFGPLVAFGLGGVFTDLLADRAYRLLPMTDVDAAELVREPRGAARVLSGFRGAPAGNLSAIEDVLLRVARLADEIPQIHEMDINPLIVTPDSATAVDVKIRLAPAPDTIDPTLRRLR
jgi:hypothetical protein